MYCTASQGSQYGGMTLGPDGNEWVALAGGIEKITKKGVATAYPLRDDAGQRYIPTSVAVGPARTGTGRTVWFTYCLQSIDLCPSSGVGTISSSGSARLNSVLHGGALVDIAEGSDGRMWFTPANATDIWAASVAGGHFSTVDYPLQSSDPDIVAIHAQAITSGPDGRIWFSGTYGTQDQQSHPCIGSITPGGFVSVVSVPTGGDVDDVTSGPDGPIWFDDDPDVGAYDPATGDIHVYSTGVTAGFVGRLALGPDGNTWFTEGCCTDGSAGSSVIGEVTPGGDVVTYADSTVNDSPIASGPDGRLWFTPTTGGVEAISTSGLVGQVLPEFLDYGITVGSDGNLWTVGEASTFSRFTTLVSRTTPDGVVTTWPLPTAPSAGGYESGPNGVVSGPDGNLWIARTSARRITRMTTGGAATSFSLPATLSRPQSITTGPDGNLWFTAARAVGEITPGGQVTAYPFPAEVADGSGITAGPGGALWFTARQAGGKHLDVVGRITTSGQFTIFPTTFAASGYARGITTGPDGNLWLSEPDSQGGNGTVLKLTPSGSFTAFALHADEYGDPPVPAGITTGPDGNLWIGGDLFVRMTTGGASIDVEPGLYSGFAIVTGPDGNVWASGPPTQRINLTTSGPASGEMIGGESPVENPTACWVLRPVNCATGELWHTFHDLSVPGHGVALDFSRTYSSALASTDGPLGHGWIDSYDMSVTVDRSTGDATVTLANGSAVTFEPVAGGWAAPPRVLATLTGDTSSGFSLALLDGTVYGFDGAGTLTRETDRNGYVTTMGYASGRLATVTDAEGRTMSFQYDPSGLLQHVSAAGGTVTFAYDAGDDLTEATDVAGGTWQFTYDGSHLMTAMTDPDGNTTHTTYDGSSRVTAQTDPRGLTTSFAYQPDQTTTTGPTGSVTVYAFFHNQLVSLTKGNGTSGQATWSYTYDPATLGLASATDPDGRVWSGTYDAAGNLLTSTDGLGRVDSYTYNSFGEILTALDASHVTTTNTYDSDGNLLSTSRPLVGAHTRWVTTYLRADSAHPDDTTGTKDPDGNLWKYGYDAYGNVVKKTDPLGNVTTYGYDALGRPTDMVTPRGYAIGGTPADFRWRYGYDALGDLTSTTDPLGETTTSKYDADGNLVSTRDPLGRVIRFAYDPDGEASTITRADGTKLTETYDHAGDLATRTDALHHTTSYTYDALDRMTSTTDPLGRQTSFGYDGAGNLTSVTDPLHRTTGYGYNRGGELTSISYSDGVTPDVTFTYDPTGLRATMTDGTGTTTYEHDSLGRLTRTVDGSGNAVAYGYDLAGNVTSITYPDGGRVTQAYDAAERLHSVEDWQSNATTFGYDPDGDLEEELYPNGITAAYTWDQAGRLSSIADSSGGSGLFRFDDTRYANGLLQSDAPTGVPGSAESYTYTPLNQLAGTGASTYAYDAAGNMQQMGSTSLTYDNANELQAATTGGQSSTFGYDADGERTSMLPQGGNQTDYAWDQAGRMTSAGTDASYAYDGDGLRATKTLGAHTEPFVWDAQSPLPTLLQDGGTRFVYGPFGRPLEQIAQDGTVLYFHQDQLGSTRALSDKSGQVVGAFAYDAFGQPTAATGSARSPLGFAGQYTDAETGFQYMDARYYDPATGQFLSQDPALMRTGQAYHYSGSDPVNGLDPSGLAESCNDAPCPPAASEHCPLDGCPASWITDNTENLIGAAADAILGDRGELVDDTLAVKSFIPPETSADTSTSPDLSFHQQVQQAVQARVDDATSALHRIAGDIVITTLEDPEELPLATTVELSEDAADLLAGVYDAPALWILSMYAPWEPALVSPPRPKVACAY
ncbi:MAG TPA: RHS repeat-associated core domain-containing protein [Actinomycetota bacterium]|nr:RHS repeat-associated core domain-containing protein [Actinomycetota bacterium]